MSDIIIKDPEFLDLAKTRIRFKVMKPEGGHSVAELNVPENEKRGVNKYWDAILDQFDINELKKRRNVAEANKKREEEFKRKKQEAAAQAQKLRKLFDKKVRVFELPFINEAEDHVKSAIRRAPDETLVDFIVNTEMKKYMDSNNMNYVDMLDYLDDLEEERLLKKQTA